MMRFILGCVAWLPAVALGAELQGQVVVRGSGDPAKLVDVVIADQTIQADENGTFTIELPDGSHTLRFESDEYAPKEIQLQMPLDRPIKVYLDAVDGPLQIVVEAFKPSAHATVHRVDAEMAFETPGTHDDSVRLVQSLPGVAIQREYSPTAGDLSVRASRPGDNRYFVDGLEVPYLYHFNQYASVFPTSQIDELKLYPSTFGAEFGDAMGAVVDATSKRQRPETVHGGVSLNTIMAGADLKVPISRKLWAAGSIRRSYHDIAANSNPQYLIWPRFSDYSARIEHGTEHNGTGVFAFGSRDRYTRAAGELDLMDPLEANDSAAFAFQRSFQIWGLRHRFQSDNVSGRFVLGRTQENRIGIFEGVGFETMKNQTWTSRLDVDGRVNDNTAWQAGWEIRHERLQLVVDGAGPSGLLVQRESPGLARGVDVDAAQRRTRVGTYGQLRLDVGNVRLFPGVRVRNDSLTGTVSVSPRFSGRWQLGEQSALKFATGHYVQAPQTELLLPGTGQPNLAVPDSWQVAAGLEQTIADRLELQLDGYVKWIDEPVVVQLDAPPQTGDRGRIAGGEFVMRYRLRDRFFLWGWFAVASSTVWSKDDVARPGDYDQPIAGGAVISWDPTRNWNLAFRYRLGSGLPYTPIVDGVYDAGRDRYEPVAGSINSARLPLYQKFDASIGYTAYFNRWTLNLRAELWVVPKASTQLYPTYSYDYSETEWVSGIPAMPLISMRATF